MRGVRLFVYGSLLRGQSNHGVLTGARFVREAITAPRYTLVDLGDYPALLADGKGVVSGELYEVAARLLAVLDEFEGHPDFYQRTAVLIENGKGAEEEAQGYILPAAQALGFPRIESGSWRARTAKR